MTAQDNHPEHSLVTIKRIRHALKPFISDNPYIATLDRQLKGWAKADEAGKSVLRPQIEANIKRLEKARLI